MTELERVARAMHGELSRINASAYLEMATDTAERLAAAAIAAVDAGGWRPIESAPREGTPFVAWCPKAGRVVMRVNGIRNETWAIDWTGRFDCEPTHWQPLPAPPKEVG